MALLAMALAAAPARAETYLLPTDGSSVVGGIQVVTIANADTTLLDVARHYDLGYQEITVANPAVGPWVPKLGSRVVVPTEFILPPGPWEGIVVNIPQRRLFYFPTPPAGQPAVVMTFPISIARAGWSTPLGRTRIVAKHRDPSWFVPKNIQEEHRAEGEPRFPTYFPPGPDNPMGMLALQTGFAEIFIHGTNKPWGVGMRTSHGCMHLYPEDAAKLFDIVPVGTPVRIIDEPVTIGARGGTLYLSATEALAEYPRDYPEATRAVAAYIAFTQTPGHAAFAELDWPRLQAAVAARRILPVPVSRGAPGVDEEIAAVPPQPYEHAPYGPDANDAAVPAAPE